MLAAFCQKKSVDFLDEADLKKLRRAYTSLRDGVVCSEYFTNRMQTLAAQNAEKAQQEPQNGIPAQTQDAPAQSDEMGLDDL
jgi:hypothetical protein